MYNQMTCLVYGLHHAAMTPWNIAFVTTDRIPKGIADTRGHLASLTRIRSQFSGNHATKHVYQIRQVTLVDVFSGETHGNQLEPSEPVPMTILLPPRL